MENEKVWANIWVTQDVCIWEGKVEVALLLVTADDRASEATMRNGRDSSGSIVCTVKATETTSVPVSFPKPFYLENGLYITVGEHTLGVLVIFRPISEITE